MKRITSLLVLSALLFLVACGTDDENVSGKNPDSGDQQVTLDFWAAWTPGSEEERKTKEQIAIFEEEHPNIKIDVQLINYDMLHDKLVTAISAGNTPDLSWGLSEWFGEFNKMDALLDLTPYVDEWDDKSVIYPNVMESLTYEGKVKALPQYLGIRALLYHADMLNEANIDAPPKTWDELIEMGPKIKAATGKEAFGIAGVGVRAPQELIAYLASNGVEIAKEMDGGKFRNTWNDSQEELQRATEVFQFYKDLLDEGVINSNAKTWGWEEEDTNFAIGQYAMVVNGPWMQDREKENPEEMADVRIAPPPYKETPATFLEISPLYLYKTTEHPEETWEFASYILSQEWQGNVRPTNSPRSDVVDDSQWGKGFTDLTETGVVFPAVSLGGITKSMEDALAKVLQNNEDPKEVAQWLSETINEDLKKNGELSE